MAFVPEGQADSSQARSAWVTMQRASVPEGSVPEGQADSSQARGAWVTMQIASVPEGRSKSLSVPNGAKIRRFGMFCAPQGRQD